MSLFILVADIEGNQKSKLCGYDEMACKWAEEKKCWKKHRVVMNEFPPSKLWNTNLKTTPKSGFGLLIILRLLSGLSKDIHVSDEKWYWGC